MQHNAELRDFARAVVKYRRGSNIPPLDVNEVDHPDDDWDTKEKLARRAFRNIAEQDARKEQQRRFGFRVLMAVESIDYQWNNEPHKFDPRNQDGVFLQIRCVCPFMGISFLLQKLPNINQIALIIFRCATPTTCTDSICMILCKVCMLVRKLTIECEIGITGRLPIYEGEYGLAQCLWVKTQS